MNHERIKVRKKIKTKKKMREKIIWLILFCIFYHWEQREKKWNQNNKKKLGIDLMPFNLKKNMKENKTKFEQLNKWTNNNYNKIYLPLTLWVWRICKKHKENIVSFECHLFFFVSSSSEFYSINSL